MGGNWFGDASGTVCVCVYGLCVCVRVWCVFSSLRTLLAVCVYVCVSALCVRFVKDNSGIVCVSECIVCLVR